MKALKLKWEKKKFLQTDLFRALFVSLLGIAFALLLGYLRLEENDDAGISNIYANVWGGGFQEYAVYVNVLLGLLLKPLYLWKSTINWYVIWNLGMCFLAFTAISWCFIRRWGRKTGLLLAFVFQLFFGWEHYCMFQYTKNAYLFLLAGFLLLLETLRIMEVFSKEWYRLLPGGFLLLAGFLLRNSCILTVAVFAGVRLLGDLIRSKKWKRYILCFGILGVLCLACTLFDQWYYGRSEEWVYYQEYNEERTICVDYGMPGYEDYKEAYESIGFSELERTMMEWWVYADKEVYTLENLKEIASWQDAVGIGRLNLRQETVKSIWTRVCEEKESLILFVVCLFLALLAPEKKRRLEVLVFPFCIALLYWYLVCNGRVNHRAVYGIWLSAAAFLIYRLGEGSRDKQKQILGGIVGILLLVLSVPIWGQEFLQKGQHQWDASYQALWDYVENDKEHLYLIDTITVVRDGMDSGTPLRTRGEGSRSNVYTLGGWRVPMPTTNAVLERYGIENPFRALAEGDQRIILVDNVFAEEKEAYLKKHYNEDVKLELIQEVGGFCLYAPVVTEKVGQ